MNDPQAKALGDVLVVGLIPDSEILRCKGPPVMNEAERFTMVNSVKWVDEVLTGEGHTAHSRQAEMMSVHLAPNDCSFEQAIVCHTRSITRHACPHGACQGWLVSWAACISDWRTNLPVGHTMPSVSMPMPCTWRGAHP